MDDAAIIALYNARAEQAISETKQKYGKYCLHIARGVLHDEEDAKECENDVYLRLWQTIPPAQPRSLKAYVASVCRNRALDLCEARGRLMRGGGQVDAVYEELAECLPGENGEDYAEATALKDAMGRFVASLGGRERQYFLRRYFYFCPIAQIAKSCGARENAVKVSLFRTRAKLKDFLEKEGLL